MPQKAKFPIVGITKLPTKAMLVLVPFFLSFAMSGIVSGISTLNHLGFSSLMLLPWINAWWLSWTVAFPCVLIILPIARKIALLLVQPS